MVQLHGWLLWETMLLLTLLNSNAFIEDLHCDIIHRNCTVVGHVWDNVVTEKHPVAICDGP